MSGKMKINYVEIGGVDVPFLILFLEHLVLSGLSMKNPVTGNVVVFKSDGDAMPIASFATIDFDACSGLQLWLDPSRDVYVSWERLNVGIGVFLEGLQEWDVVRVASLCCDFSCAYAVRENVSVKIELGNQSI